MHSTERFLFEIPGTRRKVRESSKGDDFVGCGFKTKNLTKTRGLNRFNLNDLAPKIRGGQGAGWGTTLFLRVMQAL